MRCIIAAAEKSRNAKKVIIALGGTKGLTMERLTRIMGKNEKKTWKKGLAAGIMILCFVFSSIPALAYKEPLGLEIVDADTIDLWKRADLTMAVQEENLETNYIKEMDFSQSDYLFINEADEIVFVENFELNSEDQTHVACSHNYELGSFSKHEPYSDGSCTVSTYSAQKCSKCGYVSVGSEISRIIYKVCPHE